MRVSFQTKERMLVEFDDVSECGFLLQLLDDASGNSHKASLAEALFTSSNEKTALDEYEEWKQWVKPELESTFRGQIETVRDALEDRPDSVEIDAEHYEIWYGALNLARMSLEVTYRFADVENLEEVEKWTGEKQFAFMRFQLALALQSGLLDAMD